MDHFVRFEHVFRVASQDETLYPNANSFSPERCEYYDDVSCRGVQYGLVKLADLLVTIDHVAVISNL